ncbi:Esterase [Escovopsis weberi]|uniref:Esterase n=1 Tax=Escovopsis weberi TaxID=150374 RepID=A0A0M8N4P8_ESCWE|nr:Esterase [Escovopsis weberi]
MPSLKSQLYCWYFWYSSKGFYQSSESFRKRIQARRKTQDHRPPPALYREFIIEERRVELNLPGHQDETYVVYEVAPKSELPTQAHIMYLHGGVFVHEIVVQHWDMIAQLAERLQAVVTVPIYPLGPEFKLMEIYDVVQPLHDELCLPARDNTPLWIVGDSAGATMALALTQRALQASGPVASRLVLISPMVSCVFDDEETRQAAKRDPWLDIPGLEESTRLLAPDIPPDDPRLSVINGALDELPPMMVYTASEDLLTPGTKRFVAKAEEVNCHVNLIEGEGMMHDWPLMSLPEAEQAVDLMVNWLESARRNHR